MRRLLLFPLVALLVVGLCGSSVAQPPASIEDLALGVASLGGAVVSGALIVTNLNYSPSGHAGFGVAGAGVGIATVAGGLWVLERADNRRAEVSGGVIVTAGVLAVFTGVRSVVQASTSRPQIHKSATLLPAFQVDESGGVNPAIVAVFNF